MKQKFEHNGCTYTVRAKSAFDADMYPTLLYDVAKLILTELKVGLKEDGTLNFDAVPASLDRLIARFTTYLQVTTFEGDKPPFAVDLYAMNSIEAFNAWRDMVSTDDDLYTKWGNAINLANGVNTSPKS